MCMTEWTLTVTLDDMTQVPEAWRPCRVSSWLALPDVVRSPLTHEPLQGKDQYLERDFLIVCGENGI